MLWWKERAWVAKVLFSIGLTTRDCNNDERVQYQRPSKRSGNSFAGSSSDRATRSVKPWGRYNPAGALSAPNYSPINGAAIASLSTRAQTPQTKEKSSP